MSNILQFRKKHVTAYSYVDQVLDRARQARKWNQWVYEKESCEVWHKKTDNKRFIDLTNSDNEKAEAMNFRPNT